MWEVGSEGITNWDIREEVLFIHQYQIFILWGSMWGL